MEFVPIQYRYRKARSCIQIMSYDDLMRMYSIMIHVNSWRDGYRLWSLVYDHVHDKIFDNFGDLNEAILAAVYEFRAAPQQYQQQQSQQQLQVGSKRGRSSPIHEDFAKKMCIR